MKHSKYILILLAVLFISCDFSGNFTKDEVFVAHKELLLLASDLNLSQESEIVIDTSSTFYSISTLNINYDRLNTSYSLSQSVIQLYKEESETVIAMPLYDASFWTGFEEKYTEPISKRELKNELSFGDEITLYEVLDVDEQTLGIYLLGRSNNLMLFHFLVTNEMDKNEMTRLISKKIEIANLYF